MDLNRSIDMEAARRAIAADLIAAAATPNDWGAPDPDAARMRAIDDVTDRAARLGICRARTDFDPRFAPVSYTSHVETRGRKPLPR